MSNVSLNKNLKESILLTWISFSTKVSSWTLAREVMRNGELGVISGTAMETVVCR
jgi:hypothetical protein